MGLRNDKGSWSTRKKSSTVNSTRRKERVFESPPPSKSKIDWSKPNTEHTLDY